jgi:hypothetical protein
MCTAIACVSASVRPFTCPRPPDHRARNRESRNPQFDFLKGHHFLFNYFTALVESYTKVLNPEESLVDRLRHESEDRVDILERAFQKLDWDAHVEKERQRQVGFNQRSDANDL